MKIRNVSPYGAADTPLLQQVDIVEFGEPVDVTEEQAKILLAQFENWAPVDKAAIAVCAAAIAEQADRELAATGEPSTSALKPDWVAYAASKGDPNPASKTKPALIEAYGSELPDPQEAALELAQRGEELAATAPAPQDPQDPPGNPPGGDDDDENEGGQS